MLCTATCSSLKQALENKFGHFIAPPPQPMFSLMWVDNRDTWSPCFYPCLSSPISIQSNLSKVQNFSAKSPSVASHCSYSNIRIPPCDLWDPVCLAPGLPSSPGLCLPPPLPAVLCPSGPVSVPGACHAFPTSGLGQTQVIVSPGFPTICVRKVRNLRLCSQAEPERVYLKATDARVSDCLQWTPPGSLL